MEINNLWCYKFCSKIKRQIFFRNIEKKNFIQKQTKQFILISNQNRLISLMRCDENIFLTSTLGSYDAKKVKSGLKIIDQNGDKQQNDSEVQNLQKNIINIVLQFKSLPNSMQLTHQFNQILYSLDTQLMEKKTISNIISTLKAQTNLIKLIRLFDRLRGLKKELTKLKIQKQPQKTVKKFHSSQGFRKHLIHSQNPNFTFQTLPNQNKQNQQWKQKIINQIQYKQRLSKIQSESQKHSFNKQKFMKKKIQKVKEMNKKVNEIYEKNKKLHKQRINQYKYQQLFDPNQIETNMKRRAQMMNSNYKNSQDSQTSQIDNISDEFPTQPRIGNLRNQSFKNQNFNFPSRNNLSKKDVKFDQKNIQNNKKNDISTFKTLNDLINSNVKTTKSVNNLKKNNNIETTKNLMKTNSYYCTPITKSYSFDKNLTSIIKKDLLNSSKRDYQKLQLVKEKKLQQEKQRFNKIITQAVEKQKKLLKIYNQRNLKSKTKKNSQNDQLSNDGLQNSLQTFSQKRGFKKVIITKKEQIEKQRQIRTKIESKIENKNIFLQERVNRIRQRLNRQEETKQNYRKYKEEYINLTESASVFQSTNQSPSKQISKNRLFSTDKKHQNVIKSSYLKRLKQNQQKLQQKKLANLSIDQLKKKLLHIQNQQKNTSLQNLCF